MDSIQPIPQAEILLIDDSPESIEAAITVLYQHNYRVRIATSGADALKLLRQEHPDLILLDVYMPEMDGFAVCKAIKENDSFSHIPIIFLTSSNDIESIRRGFELGAQDYVIKPFNHAELLARVHTHIALKQQTTNLQKANQELDSFCLSVAHDLKAPLLSLSKLTEYLALDYQSKLGPDGQELIEAIQEKSQDLVHIIDHLLEFSRTCQMNMTKEDINMTSLFHETYAELIKLQPERIISFTVKELPHVQGDPLMMKLLILNILSNAIKYTRDKASAIIEVCCSITESDYIFSIKDNGAGFDMRYASRLFKVFQRLHSSREFEGSGVGLAICQRIVQRHGGHVWLTGEIQKGAVFYFSLPK